MRHRPKPCDPRAMNAIELLWETGRAIIAAPETSCSSGECSVTTHLARSSRWDARKQIRSAPVPSRGAPSPSPYHPRLIVSPFLFNRKTKSDLGWAFIGLIDGGRIKEYADDGSDITRIYRHQLAACTYEVLPGPGKLLRWSVPASRGHDDLLISTALTARLDEFDWRDRTARGSLGL